MKKTFVALFGILCLCLIFISCSPSSDSSSGNDVETDEEITTVKLIITIYDYTSKADFDKKYPSGVTYCWSDSKGKSEKDLIYSGESGTIIIYPSYGSDVDVEFTWTNFADGPEIEELTIKSIVGTTYPAGINLGLKSSND